ncbi:hydantoinase/oxoprolinase family protein [Pseudonocardia acaciae]|uniref:hydantoinase/oxoprolinase family protein n=1 Tax=Pseudonocardia acaciae TaxID=551276 RepID=UPI0004907062|nr:hydantoinase/oxoprolinase family protein [Pseudonocardia acaciae]
MSVEAPFRISVDVGGTFTDLVLDDGSGSPRAFKASTTPDDPTQAITAALLKAAQASRLRLRQLLGRTELLIHGTTRALNAIVTGQTARTAFVTTKGHPDILLYAEGGRTDLFNYAVPTREPYVPRALTVEVDERIGAGGEVVRALEPAEVDRVVAAVRALGVEAVAVCLLWSPANPAHELRLAAALGQALPATAITLSHRLNPTLREYRRASSAAIDASLKPLMAAYLGGLEHQLRDNGFAGRLLVVTSSGGFQDARRVAEKPILSVKSGPAMAPVAGRRFVERELPGRTAIVTDTGGTTYDVSLVRDGAIPTTRESWIGRRYLGHMTGFSSVDIRGIGAGGGSVAWVDRGGVLHVGPRSAGSTPGPACYGLGGEEPTLTDACLVLGYLDPEYFLGGAVPLEPGLAHEAIGRGVAEPLGIDPVEAAEAVHRLATERMVTGIEEIALEQGQDPAKAVLVAGGGAGGLNAAAIGRRLDCPAVIIPHAAPVMSAFGALTSELSDEFELPGPTSSDGFDHDAVGAVLGELAGRCEKFIAGPGAGSLAARVAYSVEARYPNQVWELAVPFEHDGAVNARDLVGRLVAGFHDAHLRTFAVADPSSPVEFITWRARVDCSLRPAPEVPLDTGTGTDTGTDPEPDARPAGRLAYFASLGWAEVGVHRPLSMPVGARVAGPAIVESPMTTVVVEPGCGVVRTADGNLLLRLDREPRG